MTSATMRSFPSCETAGELPRVPPWVEAGMRLGSQNEGPPVLKTQPQLPIGWSTGTKGGQGRLTYLEAALHRQVFGVGNGQWAMGNGQHATRDMRQATCNRRQPISGIAIFCLPRLGGVSRRIRPRGHAAVPPTERTPSGSTERDGAYCILHTT
jgi:hypothetical protein